MNNIISGTTGLFCLVVGVLCITLQILVYVYLQDSKLIIVLMTCVVVFATLPLLALVIPNEIFKSPKPTAVEVSFRDSAYHS